MSIEKAKTALESASIVVGWLEKASEYFKPFTPEVKSMVVNYKNKRSEINLLLNIPDGVRRKVQSVRVPAYDNFIVHDMIDESFARVGGVWQYEDGSWKLDASNLPKSEKYLLMLRGSIPNETLNALVRIQPAVNRDQTEELDRYWLDCMLRNVALLEKIWQELNIDEVNVGVNVGIERCFSTTIPKELKRRLDTTRRWIQAGRGRDREEINRIWRDMRLLSRTSKVSVDEVLDAIRKMTTGETFGSFLAVDQPYRIGEIRMPQKPISLIPSQMSVEASTELGLKRPTAAGYLSFKKKDYTEKVKESLDKLGV